MSANVLTEAAPRKGGPRFTDHQHGHTIVVFDDQPIEDGKQYAANMRVQIRRNATEIVAEGFYPGYRIYTLLAHWADDLGRDA